MTLLLLSLASYVAAAQQPLIEEVVVHGNRRIPADTIRARMLTRPGDVYDDAGLQRDFNALWNTGYFDDLRIEREESPKGWRIHVYVKEKPTIREINYKGLNSVTQSDVLDRYKKAKVGLSVESQYDPTKVKKAETILKELLAEHGRQFAVIRSEIHPIPPAAVSVNFIVREGPKVKVGKIRFAGNKKLKNRELRSAMRNSRPIGIPKSIFFENLFSRTFDATKLQEDAERVRYEYQQKGYFKAVVGDPKTQIRDKTGFRIPGIQKAGGKVVDITVPVEEGDKYKLASIKFENARAVTNVKALRPLFPIKDGDTFNVALISKGIENLRKAYGELGYINFTSVPNQEIDEAKKTVALNIDLEEGKPFFVRRIEFQGNTTTRDKVIRRELAVEEGNVYNSRLWELSLLRLNQLGYFEPLKVEQDSETKQNVAEGTVDLTLKVKEKGKNSIGLTGGVSGLAGSFIGLNYETNNFLGLGETLTVSANVGNRERNLLFGFTEPYFLDRPINLGFTVFTSKYDFNAAKNTEILTGQRLNLPQDILNTLQNFSNSRTGFTVSASYPLKRSFKRIGLTYSFDNSSIQTFSDASKLYFDALNFRGISGPNSLTGIITSKLIPSFTFNTVDSPLRPHRGRSLFIGTEIAGIGGNVNLVRPVTEYKQFVPINKERNTLGFRIQGSFLSGFGGKVAPPFERFYLGGENDLRGFDIRSVTPYTYIANRVDFPLVNPDGTPVPRDPTNPRRGNVTVPIPVQTLTFAGGDTSIVSNIEYRVPIVGPVTIAAFNDFGMVFSARGSQLQLSSVNLNELNSTIYGCPGLASDFSCNGGRALTFNKQLQIASGTNYVPRMSTGIEFQVILPIVQAPFRLYYAYNPLLLDALAPSKSVITRSMFPPGGAGDFSFLQAQQQFAPDFRLREPRKTFRFTVSTTF